VEIAGEAGSFMLGNIDGSPTGADMGQLDEPRAVLDSLTSIGFGRAPFTFSESLSSSAHSLLRSVRAVDGPLSVGSLLMSFSESSESFESLLLLLLRVLLAVLFLLSSDFPVCGGVARHGEISDMPLKKSK